MNRDKAKFFDEQADAPWAAPDYTAEEIEKINWLFQHAGIGPGMRVLEPGCGTGRLTKILCRAVGSKGAVTAMDISRGMIQKAREKLSRLQNVSLHLCALEEMGIEPESFDLVLCFNVFPHFDQKQKALEIFHQVLAPSGRLAIFHLHPSSFINDLHRKADTPVQNDMIPPESELKSMLKLAGFKPLKYRDDDRFFALAVKPG